MIYSRCPKHYRFTTPLLIRNHFNITQVDMSLLFLAVACIPVYIVRMMLSQPSLQATLLHPYHLSLIISWSFASQPEQVLHFHNDKAQCFCISKPPSSVCPFNFDFLLKIRPFKELTSWLYLWFPWVNSPKIKVPTGIATCTTGTCSIQPCRSRPQLRDPPTEVRSQRTSNASRNYCWMPWIKPCDSPQLLGSSIGTPYRCRCCSLWWKDCS